MDISVSVQNNGMLALETERAWGGGEREEEAEDGKK
jgi:hypothetical protein